MDYIEGDARREHGKLGSHPKGLPIGFHSDDERLQLASRPDLRLAKVILFWEIK